MFNRISTFDRGTSTDFLALFLVALVPTACVLWFMSVAMRNERLAVQERLTDVYLNHLTSLQRQVTSFWLGRPAALQSAGHDSPAQIFAAIGRANLADSVVVCDHTGTALDPSAASLSVVNFGELKPEEKRSVRARAEDSLVKDSKPYQALKVRPESWKERIVAGKPPRV